MSTKRLLVIVGPTGSGKTDLSIRLAGHYAAPILSTDSRQVYRGMPIGTAQPTFDQLQAVDHHFIASHDIKDYLSCGEYEVQALARLEKLFAGHDYVVAVGGAGRQVAVILGKTLDNGKRSPCRSAHRILSPFALSQYLPQLPALQMRRRETPIRLRVHIADITVNHLKYTAPMENVKSFSKNFYEMLPLFCCSGSA